MKCETHNHPTAIAPFPGAATGAGGEIRDEGATGRGAKPKAGLAGFSVSHLRIPGARAALGGARPRQAGAHRLGARDHDRRADRRGGVQQRVRPAQPRRLLPHLRACDETRGYHKPIMLAGGFGNTQRAAPAKAPLPPGTLLIQLGGPGLLIGMGGGAASSMGAGANVAELDFDSVQRGNAEIERRAQEVIDRCWQMGEANPILSIHDVGAGGLSNALPELAHAAGRGARLDLRAIPTEDSGMSPREIWCNEAQERYVLAIAPASLDRIPRASASASAAPSPWWARATADGKLVVEDPLFGNRPVDIALEVLLGKPPRMHRDVKREIDRSCKPLSLEKITLKDAALPRPAPPDGGRQDLPRSPSATAPSAACARATRWWARGRCRWPTAR